MLGLYFPPCTLSKYSADSDYMKAVIYQYLRVFLIDFFHALCISENATVAQWRATCVLSHCVESRLEEDPIDSRISHLDTHLNCMIHAVLFHRLISDSWGCV